MGDRDIYLTDEQYLAALKRIRASIVSGTALVAEDSDDVGNKYTRCTWGLCSDRKEDWPNPEDHLWPDQFKKQGRVAPKYRREHQFCPMDRRVGQGGVNGGSGCFYSCRIFKPKRGPRVTAGDAIRMYDVAIDGVQEDELWV